VGVHLLGLKLIIPRPCQPCHYVASVVLPLLLDVVEISRFFRVFIGRETNANPVLRNEDRLQAHDHAIMLCNHCNIHVVHAGVEEGAISDVPA